MTGDRSFDDILGASAASQSATGETPRQQLDLGQAMAELASINLRTADLSSVLQRIAELAQKTVPGADEVSVTLLGNRGQAVSPAYTGQMALDADEQQYANGEGPCLEAARVGEPRWIDDTATEARWPDYIARAREVGVRSSVSVPLPVQETVTGALNIYSRSAHAFDEESRELAQSFVGYAAVAVANTHLYETTAALARQMQDAMESRAVIEQAKGLIMGQRRCSADAAFQLLVTASQHSNRKLRDIAAELLASVQNAEKPR